MANNFDKIIELANANNMGLSNTIKRDFGIPLDFTSVQENYGAAVKYAATNTLAYVGQPLSVGNKLYIVTDTANGTYVVGEGEEAVTYDVYLAEVGSATEGDGVSIDLDNGVLALHGFKAAAGATLPRVKIVTDEGGAEIGREIEWVPVDAIVEGDGNTKTVVGVVEGSAISVTKTHDDETDTDTYTLDVTLPDVYTKTEAEEKFAEKTALDSYVLKETYNSEKAALDGQIADRYTKSEADEKFLLKTDAYDDTALAARVGAVETGLGNVYTKTETYTKEEVNSAIAGITHFSTQVVESTDEMVSDKVLYLVKVESATGADVYNEYLVIGGVPTLIGDTTTDLSDYVTNTALATALGDYYTKTDIDGKGYAIASEVNSALATKADASALADYAVKSEVETALGNKADASALGDYYTKDEVDGKGYAVETSVAERFSEQAADIATKVGSAEISHSTETVAEGATVENGKLTIVVDAYTKAETLTKIQEKITEINGGESAGEVLGQLNSYKETNDARVGAIETKNTEQDSAIAAARNQADKGVQDAATAQAAADKNATDITTLSNLVSGTGEGDTTSHAYRLGQLEATDAAHATEFNNLKGKVDGIVDTTIPGLSSNITANANAIDNLNDTVIPGIQTTLGGKADKATTLAGYGIGDAYTKTEVDGLLENLDQSALEQGIADNKTAIEAEVSRATAAEAANKALIDKLIGEDTDKSARTIATEVLAGALEGANESFDTLIEMATWLAEHSTDAVEMDNRIAANEAILADFGGEGEPTTVKGYVDSAIAAAAYQLPVATLEALGGVKSSAAENKVSVAEDGTMEVNSLNVNKLVQTEGETLVLHGGDAEVVEATV